MMSFSVDYLLLMFGACLAAPHTIDLGHNARLSTSQPFVLAAIVLFGVREAAFLSAVGTMYFWLVGRPRLPFHKGLYNFVNLLLATWLGGLVYCASGGRLGDVASAPSLLALFLTTLTFFTVNTGLVSIAVAIEQRISPLRVWYEKYSWTLNTHLAGGSMVVLIGLLRAAYGPLVLYLLLPFCVLTFHFYKVYSPRAAPATTRTGS